MPTGSHGPLVGPGRARRILPFAAATVVAFITLGLPGHDVRMSTLVAALALTGVLGVAVVTVPWTRLPTWAQGSVPLAFLAVAALLRDADGASRSGLSALIILPVLWVALYGTWRQLTLTIAGAGVVFLAPILVIGAPDYPAREWTRVILWPVLAGIVGHAVHRLVQEQRSRADNLEVSSIFLQAVLDSVDVGITACDAGGRPRLANNAARAIHGSEPTGDAAVDDAGDGYRLFAADGVTPILGDDAPLARALRGERVHDEEVAVAPSAGPLRRAVIRCQRITRTDGRVLGAVMAMHDVTDRRAAEQAVRDSEERLRLLVDATVDYAILMLGPDGRVQTWNTGAQRLKGYESDEIVGQHVSVLYPPGQTVRDDLDDKLAKAAENGRFAEECWIARKDGSVFWAGVVLTAIHDPAGRLRGFSLITRDLTEVRAAENLKDQFLAVVSHELRTPLTSIIGFLEMLLDDTNNLSDAQVQFLTTIDRNAHRLLRLVGDLLLTAQIDAGSVTLDLRSVDVAVLAAAAVEAAQPRATASNISLRLQPGQLPPVTADPERLGQVLDNLLSNAIKFTPGGGRVDLKLTAEGAGVAIEVSDTGIGIPVDEQGLMFERFFRASTAVGRAIPGVGLGLTIVKTIVEAHHGTLSMSSAEGVGTTFRIELPLEQPRRRLSARTAHHPASGPSPR
ncbi:ATP-binding protein [Flexivirga alba]|uniref:histidine kinase n=1 Tax=Flexivirga alba TaxID=702742 RepID=A0ABW2AD74_9MICO